MMRLKIAEGDLIIIGAINKATAMKLGEGINEWLKHRGISDVNIMLGFGEEYSNTPATITVLSVNDVFQDVVLNERTKLEAEASPQD